MPKGRSLIVGLVVAVLCLSSSMALADGACKKQHAKMWKLTDAFEDPEICNGYEICQFFELVGTLNGAGGWYRANDWLLLVADFTALVIWADMKIETRKGELSLQERCIIHLGAGDAACTAMVVGGTGDYAGATGWLAHVPDFPAGTHLVHGEICSGSE